MCPRRRLQIRTALLLHISSYDPCSQATSLTERSDSALRLGFRLRSDSALRLGVRLDSDGAQSQALALRLLMPPSLQPDLSHLPYVAPNATAGYARGAQSLQRNPALCNRNAVRCVKSSCWQPSPWRSSAATHIDESRILLVSPQPKSSGIATMARSAKH